MKVYFSKDELLAVKRSLKSSVDLYSRSLKLEQPGGPLAGETSVQKFRFHQRHVAALKSALRRLTPQGGAIE